MTDDRHAAWLSTWLNAVRDGSARTAIDRHGGLQAAIAAAKERQVHLVELTDDEGKLLVAASRRPFAALCSNVRRDREIFAPFGRCNPAASSPPVRPVLQPDREPYEAVW